MFLDLGLQQSCLEPLMMPEASTDLQKTAYSTEWFENIGKVGTV